MQTREIICGEPLDILKRRSIKKQVELLPSLFDRTEGDDEYADMVSQSFEDKWCYSDEESND